MFENKRNVDINRFSVTHFGVALDLSDIDLWNIDLLDTHLDFLDTDITSKHFVCLQDVLKTSSRYLLRTSSRRLEDVFQDVKLLGWRRIEDVFETSWRPTNVCWRVASYPNDFHFQLFASKIILESYADRTNLKEQIILLRDSF